MKKKTLTREDILHLAKLSKIELTSDEIDKYLEQLEETVEFVNNLNELKTDNVIPTSQTTNITNRYFEDGDKNKRTLDKIAAANAKNKKNGYFTVKRIM